jgi:putative transposase
MAEDWRSAAGWAAEAKAVGVDPRAIMPHTKAGVIAKADREGWAFREREASGGGREYPLSGLPKAFQDALDQAERAQRLTTLTHLAVGLAAKVPMVSEAAVREAARQTGNGNEGRGDVRVAIVNLYKLFLANSDWRDGSNARLRFADLYNTVIDTGAETFTAGAVVNGQRILLAVPAWVRKAKPHIAHSSLWNWQRAVKKGEIAALDGRYKGGRKSALDQAQRVRDYILGSVLKGRDLSAVQLRDEIVATFGELVEVIDDKTGEVDQVKIPSSGQICRWVNAWKEENSDFLLHEINPDKWKSKNRISIGDLYGHIERPNQLWEIDASPADLMLLEDDGRTAGRYTLYVLIDIYTRRIMVLVTKTAATAGALLLLRKGIEAWGKPEMVRTDQGSDFISQEAKRFFALLGIIHDDCTAYSPEQKGGVERHVKTVQHGIINQLPGYIGHSVADRTKIEARKAFSGRLGLDKREAFAIEIGRDELQATLNDWCEFKYAHKPHGGLKGETPFNRAMRYPGKVMRIDDPERLAMLLAPVPKSSKGAGIRTVTKKGIQVEDSYFYAKPLHLFMGKDVFVRMDPDDMGQVWVFSADHSEFIGKATNIERLGVERAACAAEAKAHQSATMKELRKEGRRLKSACRPHKMVTRVLAKAKTDASKVVYLPRTHESFTNAALEAVGVAMRSGQPVQASPVTAAEQVRLDALAVDLSAPKVVTMSPKASQFQRAMEIEARIDAGAAVDDKDRKWLAVFQHNPTYLALKPVCIEYGIDTALNAAM